MQSNAIRDKEEVRGIKQQEKEMDSERKDKEQKITSLRRENQIMENRIALAKEELLRIQKGKQESLEEI